MRQKVLLRSILRMYFFNQFTKSQMAEVLTERILMKLVRHSL